MNEDNEEQNAYILTPKLTLHTCSKCDVTIEALFEATVWCRKGHLMERISNA